jgi:hypothetical protein
VTSVQFDFRAGEVYAYLKDVPRGVARATSRAINSMNRDIRDDAIKSVTGIYNIPSKAVNKSIKFVRSGPNRLYAVWRSQGDSIPLRQYSPRGGKPLGKGVPVSVEVLKNKREVVAGGFIGTSGHILRRKGHARYPSPPRFGPSVPSAFIKDQVMQSMVRVSERLLPRRIESEMVRELRKVATGSLPKA